MPGNHAAYDEVIKGLKAIKDALKKCANPEQFHSILASYSSINVKKKEVQDYIKEHEKKRIELITLESKITNLITANRHVYGVTPPEPEVRTDVITRVVATVKTDVVPQIVIDHSKDVVADPGKGTVEVAPKQTAENASKGISEVVLKPKSPVAPEPKPEEELEKKQRRMVRERQLSQFTILLKQLEAKRDAFHILYPEDSSELTTKAYGASFQLVKKLEQCAESYKNGDSDLNQFKKDSSLAIDENRNGVLSQHRGYKEILANLLLFIGSLGIGYIAAALFTQRINPIKFNTNSINKLNKTQEAVEELKPEPSIA